MALKMVPSSINTYLTNAIGIKCIQTYETDGNYLRYGLQVVSDVENLNSTKMLSVTQKREEMKLWCDEIYEPTHYCAYCSGYFHFKTEEERTWFLLRWI